MANVTIIIPLYNSESYIEKTLVSLLDQSRSDYKVVFVDDCSDDDTVNVVNGFLTKFVDASLICLKENVGPGKARNVGVHASKSNLIAFLDSDDIWEPDKLEIQLGVHKATRCAFSCTAFRFGKNEIFQDRTDYDALLKNNVINTSSVMFDKSQVNIEFESEYKSEDYVAWLDVAKKTQIQFINKVLVERRELEGLSANKFAMAARRWQIYRNIEKLGFLRALYYFSCYAVSGLIKHAKS